MNTVYKAMSEVCAPIRDAELSEVNRNMSKQSCETQQSSTNSNIALPIHWNDPKGHLFSAALAKVAWRKGKWTEDEELYTQRLIESFNAGQLKIPTGTTLRSYLSEKLSW